MRNLFTIPNFFKLKHFKFHISLCVAAVFFFSIYQIADYNQIFQYNPDEGYYFMRSVLNMQGYALYDEIGMDQPPVMVKLLSFTFKFLGASVAVSRTLILTLISLMMMALFYMIYKTQNIFSAVCAMVLICSISNFIKFSVSVMNGLPAIAFAVFACLCVYFYERHRRVVFLILSGFLLAIGLQTKLFVIVFVPAILIELFYIELKKSSFKFRWNHFYSLVLWITSLIIAYCFIAWTSGIDYSQIFNPYALAKVYFSEKPFSKVLSWVTRNREIFFLAAGSLMCFRYKSMTLFFIPFIVTISSFLIFAQHVPIWDHHRLLMLIPAAWLASFAVYEFFSFQVWSELRKSKLKKKICVSLKLFYIGIALIFMVFDLKSNAYYAVKSLDKTTLADVKDVIDLINDNKNSSSVLVTDTPSFAFHTQVLIPPALSTISKKQIQTGLITAESIIRIINRGKSGYDSVVPFSRVRSASHA